MPVEPVSITLAAIALLEPAVKGCIEAYGVYKLTKEFGDDFCEYSRKHNAQRARLEEWYNWPFYYTGTPTRSDHLISVIEQELGAMKIEFQHCSDIMIKFSPRDTPSTSPAITVSSASTVPLVPKKKTSLLNNVFHLRKSKETASDISSIGEHSPASTSSGLAARSSSTPASSLLASGPTDTAAATAAAHEQESDAKDRQSSVTIGKKFKWLSERKAFLQAVNKLIASNDLVESLIRARTSKPKPEPIDIANINLPDEVLTTQASLERLHLALKAANNADTGRFMFGVSLVSNPFLTAEDVRSSYHEVRLRENSLVFRLQAHKPSENGTSRLLLAETLCDKPPAKAEPSEQDFQSVNNIALVPLHSEGDDAFVPIRHVTTPGSPSDKHYLFQDVSANWAHTSTLAELFSEKAPDRPSRYSLAALLAFSSLCFTPDKLLVDGSQAKDYCYYDSGPNEQGNEKVAIIKDQDRLLSPYLMAGLGSPPPKMPTRAFGGARGVAPIHNQQIVALGLLLYQIGRWHPLDHATSISAREGLRTVVREHMHDLHRETGMGFAETVQLCLDWKYTAPKDQRASQVLLYEKVVETLRKLDEAVRVRPYELG